jgi:hypothetical protein
LIGFQPIKKGGPSGPPFFAIVCRRLFRLGLRRRLFDGRLHELGLRVQALPIPFVGLQVFLRQLVSSHGIKGVDYYGAGNQNLWQCLDDVINETKLREEAGDLKDVAYRFTHARQPYAFTAAGDIPMKGEQCPKADAGDVRQTGAIEYDAPGARCGQIKQLHLGGDRIAGRQGAIEADHEMLRVGSCDNLELHRTVAAG